VPIQLKAIRVNTCGGGAAIPHYAKAVTAAGTKSSRRCYHFSGLVRAPNPAALLILPANRGCVPMTAPSQLRKVGSYFLWVRCPGGYWMLHLFIITTSSFPE
jgi:hypothetical protein